MREPNPSALEAHLLRTFRAVVSDQHSTLLMSAVAVAFGAFSLLRKVDTLVSEAAPSTAMTLGPVIFLPRGALTPDERLDFILHGVTHVAQFWDDPVEYVRAYLGSAERRTLFEVEAERGRLEARWLLEGKLPEHGDLGHFLRHGYAVDAPDVAFAGELLEVAVTGLQSGLLATRVGHAVEAFLLDDPNARGALAS